MSKKRKRIVCRNCNTPIAKNAKICPVCGAKNKKPFYQKWWFIALVVIIVIGTIGSIGSRKKEKFDWNDVEFCDRLPEPKSNVGEIISNSSDSLYMNVGKMTRSDYKDYMEECQSMGYTVESERDGDAYIAYDEEGYNLQLNYMGESMTIALEAPMEMGTLSWPKSEIAGLLPVPKSSVGNVSIDTTEQCCIYVGETPADVFNEYVDECSDYGFSVDYEREDKSYNAKDEDGNELSLAYEGNKVMRIQITKSEEEDETEEEKDSKLSSEEKSEEKSDDSSELVDGMRPEFKKAMDSYEEFMDEYCEFMKKYEESDGASLELMDDYLDYMDKYADVMEDFEDWDDGEMNAAETEYYVDVQTRVSKKLIEVGE